MSALPGAAAEVVALASAAIAVVTDERCRRIPNRLTASAAILGVALALAAGAVAGGGAGAGWSLAASLAGGATGLVVLGVPGAFGLVGMGDVKLVAALGLLLSWPAALGLVLYTALAGGLVALAHAIARGRVQAVVRNLGALRAGDERHRIPYALAIAAGCAWAIAARHLPALALV